MNTLWQDLRYGLRMLLKRPGFTAVAILALALGIGANTAIFSVVNSVVLRPLPFSAPERLIAVESLNLQRSTGPGAASYPDFLDWKAQNHVFEGIAAYHTNDFTLTGGTEEPAHLPGAVVSADLFELLGERPSMGRSFLAEEDKPGGGMSGRAVILSHDLWQRRFNSDPNVLKQSIVLDGKSFNIVGVMPAGFQFPIQAQRIELWTTFAVDAETSDGSKPITEHRGAHYLNVIARLRADVSVKQAQAEMETITSNLAKQYPDTDSHRGVSVVPELEQLVGDIRPALLILLGAVGCVLLIACANVANLLLARATTRHKEMAIRAALGASRWRVVRQLLTESVLLSSVGGALGLLLAMWGIAVLLRLSPENIPRLAETGLDGRVLGFTLLVSLLTGILFGLAPALHSSKSGLAESLKEGGRSGTEGASRNHVRGALVVVEVALALVLLVGAGLLIRTLLRMERVNPGFDPHNVLTLNISPPDVKYSAPQQVEFYRQLLSRIETLPGVVRAGAVTPLPLSEDNIGTTFDIEERPVAESERPVTFFRAASPGYFRTMSIPLLKGRGFTEHDDLKGAPVCIVNETFARKFFSHEDALGKRIQPGVSIDDSKPKMREIIGIVGDVKHRSLTAESGPEVYVPHAQIPFTMTLVVRARTDPQSLIAPVRDEVRALDRDLPVYDIKTLDQYLASSVARPRFNMLLLAVFAGVALLLTAVGLYGVLAYTVAQRTHEIGIRIALGAQPSDILKLVVKQGMVLALAGVGIGLAAAFAVTRVMSSLLYEVSATDTVTFIGVSVLLAVVALLACYIPARRATKVDPMVALRYE